MPKKCRKRTDTLLEDALKDKRTIMKETLESLKEEINIFKLKKQAV